MTKSKFKILVTYVDGVKIDYDETDVISGTAIQFIEDAVTLNRTEALSSENKILKIELNGVVKYSCEELYLEPWKILKENEAEEINEDVKTETQDFKNNMYNYMIKYIDNDNSEQWSYLAHRVKENNIYNQKENILKCLDFINKGYKVVEFYQKEYLGPYKDKATKQKIDGNELENILNNLNIIISETNKEREVGTVTFHRTKGDENNLCSFCAPNINDYKTALNFYFAFDLMTTNIQINSNNYEVKKFLNIIKKSETAQYYKFRENKKLILDDFENKKFTNDFEEIKKITKEKNKYQTTLFNKTVNIKSKQSKLTPQEIKLRTKITKEIEQLIKYQKIRTDFKIKKQRSDAKGKVGSCSLKFNSKKMKYEIILRESHDIEKKQRTSTLIHETVHAIQLIKELNKEQYGPPPDNRTEYEIAAIYLDKAYNCYVKKRNYLKAIDDATKLLKLYGMELTHAEYYEKLTESKEIELMEYVVKEVIGLNQNFITDFICPLKGRT